MGALLGAAAGAFWLGILTAISPCPMATNIAAISFIGRRVGSPRKVLLSGLLYAAGRTLAYVVLAALLVAGLLYKRQVSFVLQSYLNKALGPVLILVGMVLVELIQVRLPSLGPGERTQRWAESMGVWGSGLLGIVFALAFCPISAVYFFSLLPLCVGAGSSILVPTVFGVGTAAPVVAFAFLIALSAGRVGAAFNRLRQVEWWARRVTGAVFILVGIYFCLVYIFVAF